MKLVMAIVDDEDSLYLSELLNKKGFFVTKLASTGGFLRAGATTLISGVEEDRVQELIDIIEKNCKTRTQVTSMSATHMGVNEGFLPLPMDITVGGATIFVLNVEEFKKV